MTSFLDNSESSPTFDDIMLAIDARIITRRSFSTMIKYISGDELANIIKSDKVPHKDYLIVDVRDDDWAGGNIKRSHNIPSQEFHLKVNDLIVKTKDVPTVIFHCALSQARGPKAARIYKEICDNLETQGSGPSREVLILRGGFSQFQIKYKNDPELVENWDKEVWESEWS